MKKYFEWKSPEDAKRWYEHECERLEQRRYDMREQFERRLADMQEQFSSRTYDLNDWWQTEMDKAAESAKKLGFVDDKGRFPWEEGYTPPSDADEADLDAWYASVKEKLGS